MLIFLGKGGDSAGVRLLVKTLDDKEFEHQNGGVVMSWRLLIIVLAFDGFRDALQSGRVQVRCEESSWLNLPK